MLSEQTLTLAVQLAVIAALICIALEVRRRELAYQIISPAEETPGTQGGQRLPQDCRVTLWSAGADPIAARDFLSPGGLQIEAKGAEICAAEISEAHLAESQAPEIHIEEGKLWIEPFFLQRHDRLTLDLHLAQSAPALVVTGALKKVSTVREVRSSQQQRRWMQRCRWYIRAAIPIGALLVGASYVKISRPELRLPAPQSAYLYLALAYLLSVVLVFLWKRRIESDSSFAYPLIVAK